MESYGLGGVDCPICRNRGYVLHEKDGAITSEECACMGKRRSLRRIRNSGMSDMLTRYTFDSYETPDATRTCIKMVAERFCKADTGWFYICGRSGSGKTHICTAICSRLIESGKETRYMCWTDEAPNIKAKITDGDAYESAVMQLKRIPVLYIDDLFKPPKGMKIGKEWPTQADLRLAFEIINSRYNDTKLRTVISSELMWEDIQDIDEALGGRIKERSKGYLVKSADENWRLK